MTFSWPCLQSFPWCPGLLFLPLPSSLSLLEHIISWSMFVSVHSPRRWKFYSLLHFFIITNPSSYPICSVSNFIGVHEKVLAWISVTGTGCDQFDAPVSQSLWWLLMQYHLNAKDIAMLLSKLIPSFKLKEAANKTNLLIVH